MSRRDYSSRRHAADVSVAGTLAVEVSATIEENAYVAGNLMTQGVVDHNSQRVRAVGTPVDPADAVPMGYADNPTATPGTLAPFGTWAISSHSMVRKAGWVMLRMAFSKPTAATTGDRFAIVPAGFRPSAEWLGLSAFGAAASGGGHKIYMVSVNAAGELALRGVSYPAAGEALIMAAQWPLA